LKPCDASLLTIKSVTLQRCTKKRVNLSITELINLKGIYIPPKRRIADCNNNSMSKRPVRVSNARSAGRRKRSGCPSSVGTSSVMIVSKIL
jgi:hypothetical protein